MRTRRRGPDQPDTLYVLAETAWHLWRWKLELTLAILATIAILAITATPPALAIILAAAIVAALYYGWPWLGWALHAAHVKREWTRAVIDVGAADPPPKKSRRPVPFLGPRCTKVTRVLAGDLLRVRVGRGQAVRSLENATHELAAALEVRDVRVMRDRSNASRATVLLVRNEPFHNADPVPWPMRHDEIESFWQPVWLGMDEDGNTVKVGLVERNLLVGGEPGAGKSVALSIFAATAALDPETKLWLMDGKEVELAAWAPCAERSVGANAQDAIDMLRALRTVMEDRYRELLSHGLRKIEKSADMPLHVVICDELAFYMQPPSQNRADVTRRNELVELIRDLVARGRAAGIIVIAATQKPSVDMVPSALRDLFGFRLALRCNTPQASDTILGQGWASNGADASTIPGGQRGVGYLLAEGERPILIRGFYLSDQDVSEIATRGAARRTDQELSRLLGAGESGAS